MTSWLHIFGKLLHSELVKITMLLMGKSTISTRAISNSYVTNYQRVHIFGACFMSQYIVGDQNHGEKLPASPASNEACRRACGIVVSSPESIKLHDSTVRG